MTKIIAILLRAGLGGVFLFAGLSKIGRPYAFLEQVFMYEMVPQSIALAVAMFFPWMEIVLGAFVLYGLALRGSYAVMVTLGAVFVVAQMTALLRGSEISCGCFGGELDEGKVSGFTIARTALLAALATVALLQAYRQQRNVDATVCV
jgi:uncharacterized membrane protein YphA (DoxX/SURF4 family)